jgi:AcrR family transcriptional regulator
VARVVAGRADVVPKLVEVFREHGYEGTSLSSITKRTGLGKGSLYHFFPGGKEEMAEAVLDYIGEWFEINVFNPLETEEPAAAIEHMFLSVSNYFLFGRRACLMGTFALDYTRGRFPERLRGYFCRWIDALGAALVRGGLDQDEAMNRANEVVGGIQGAIVLARALNSEAPFLASVERLKIRATR